MNKKKVYIILFAILYAIVGIVSTIHAVSFFALANVMVVGVMLAIAFEVGQAAVLFSILTDIRKRKKIMPWLLMTVLTIVQVMGNVYSSYKYLITKSEANLRFFKEPIFVWSDIPDATANVLLVYLIGGVLPIVSLLMTAMLTSYLGNQEEIVEEEEEYEEEEKEYPEELDDEDPDYVSPYKELTEEEKEIPEVPYKLPDEELEEEETEDKQEVEESEEEEPEEQKPIESHSVNL